MVSLFLDARSGFSVTRSETETETGVYYRWCIEIHEPTMVIWSDASSTKTAIVSCALPTSADLRCPTVEVGSSEGSSLQAAARRVAPVEVQAR